MPAATASTHHCHPTFFLSGGERNGMGSASQASVRSHQAMKDEVVLLCIRTPVTLIHELKLVPSCYTNCTDEKQLQLC